MKNTGMPIGICASKSDAPVKRILFNSLIIIIILQLHILQVGAVYYVLKTTTIVIHDYPLKTRG